MSLGHCPGASGPFPFDHELRGHMPHGPVSNEFYDVGKIEHS